MKPKIKPHGDEVTCFYNKEIPKVDSNHTCLAVISLDSAVKKHENYYPQVFLKECKYIKKKLISHMIDDIESSSDDSHDSDEEYLFLINTLSWLLFKLIVININALKRLCGITVKISKLRHIELFKKCVQNKQEASF